MLKSLEGYFNTIKENSFTEYSELDATNIKVAREEFFEDETLRVPNFRYEREEQTPEYLRGVLQKLNKTRSEILRDTNLKGSEKKLVYQLIKASQGTATLLLAASEYRRGIDPDRNALKFACCNKNEYGTPSKEMVFSLLAYELEQLKTDSFGDEENYIYQRLLINLPKLEDVTVNYFAPHRETIAEFNRLFRHHFAPFFDGLPKGKVEFTPEEVVELANEVIGQIQVWSGTEFCVKLSDTKSNLSVDQLERVLYIPRHRTLGPYTREVVETKLCAHEFIHLFRGVPYEKCGVPALAYGFPGYDEAEEGITTACEYAIRGGEYIPQNADRYVNIGLLYHFGEEGFDFRKVFEIRRDLYYLSKVNPASDAETKKKCFRQAIEQAFTEVSRATRGTGTLVYCKDLIYFNGNQKVLQYIENAIKSGGRKTIDQMFDDFFWSGKTNPFDEQQLKIARAAAKGKFGKPIMTP